MECEIRRYITLWFSGTLSRLDRTEQFKYSLFKIKVGWRFHAMQAPAVS